MTLAQGFIIEYLQLLSEVNFSTNHMTFQIVLCCGVVGYCVIWESNNCLHHALLRNRNIVHTLLVTFQWHSWMSFFTQSIKRTTLEHQQHKKMTGASHIGLEMCNLVHKVHIVLLFLTAAQEDDRSVTHCIGLEN